MRLRPNPLGIDDASASPKNTNLRLVTDGYTKTVINHLMKRNFWNIILIFNLLLGCHTGNTLDGNYSTCIEGEYIEIYFNKDSMRVASENVWVGLSEWRKIEIINDTLYFETFGEWKDQSSAKIRYLGMNNAELSFLETDGILNLKQMNVKLTFKDSLKFWKGFKNRMNNKKCI